MVLEELNKAEELYTQSKQESNPLNAIIMNNEAAYITVDYLVSKLGFSRSDEIKSIQAKINETNEELKNYESTEKVKFDYSEEDEILIKLEQSAQHADAIYELSILIAENLKPGKYEININNMRTTREEDKPNRETWGPRYKIFNDNESSFETLTAIALNLDIPDLRIQENINLARESHENKTTTNKDVEIMSSGLYIISKVLSENVKIMQLYLKE